MLAELKALRNLCPTQKANSDFPKGTDSSFLMNFWKSMDTSSPQSFLLENNRFKKILISKLFKSRKALFPQQVF